jgi:putative N-acetylmannosamine-6-phosphate epimerase
MNPDLPAVLHALRGGLIVSCQAREGMPLRDVSHMVAMARCAKLGGAVGLRACGVDDIRAEKEATGLPVIGLEKIDSPGFDIYITPTLESILRVADAGADIVALDATDRPRPDGRSLRETVGAFRAQRSAPLMADVSTVDEGIAAADAGFDVISTTLSGYTPYSPQQEGPDFDLLQELVNRTNLPIIAEGRIWRPEEAARALELGAWAVVVGSAITRPEEITRRFAAALKPVA